MRRALRRAAVVLSAAVALLCAGPVGSAQAHAVLVRSTPTDGVRLTAPPAQVRLVFDEAVGLIPDAVRLLSAAGVPVGTDPARLTGADTTVLLPVRPGLARGSYTVTWRVVSADSHLVSGSVTFGVGVDPVAAALPRSRSVAGLDAATDVGTGLAYAGLVLLVGLLAAVRIWWPPTLAAARLRPLVWAGWGLLLVGTAGPLLLQGPRAESAGWRGVWHGTGLADTVSGRLGQELLARLAVLLVVAVLLARVGPSGLVHRSRTAVAGGLGLALLVGVGLTGHGAAGSHRALALPAAVLHLAAMSVWLGGLVALVALVRPEAARSAVVRPEAATSVLRRWSYGAYGCVAVLVLTGEYQAARQIAPVAALWSTRYGVLLLIKVAAVALTVAAAGVAQRRVVRASAVPARALRRAVRIEVGLAAAVLGVTAVLVAQPPAAASYGPAVDVLAPLGPDRAAVHVDTTRRGPTRIAVVVRGPDDHPVSVRRLTAQLSHPAVGTLPVHLQVAPDRSSWRSRAAVAGRPGVWTLTLTVRLAPTESYVTAVHWRVW